MKDLALAFFTTTKGHFGNRIIFTMTINDILAKYDFIFKIAHIKVSLNEQDIAEKMDKFLTKKGFKVIKTLADWDRNSLYSNFHRIHDINKIFSDKDLNKYDFTLWLEDDWLFKCEKQRLDSEFALAISTLKNNTDYFTYRFVRDIDKDVYQRALATPFFDGIYSSNKEFSFNPNIVRTRDLYFIANIVYNNYKILHPHCEMAYWQICNALKRSDKFLFLTDRINVQHIGEEDFAKIYSFNL